MRRACIEFTAWLEVTEDGDEWEGGDMSNEDAAGWIAHALARGDKHASNYTAYNSRPTSVTYEDVEEEE
ncbi:hypothetical protein [Streptomyces sp. CAU 1734]|uniref:hypothetical protein n=1 Tax=Streptomyces sp. CAU 1734 TaxID=3140360 RepID=UPI0032618870